MRKDVKIGIAIALLGLIAVVAWVVVGNDGETTNPDNTEGQKPPPKAEVNIGQDAARNATPPAKLSDDGVPSVNPDVSGIGELDSLTTFPGGSDSASTGQEDSGSASATERVAGGGTTTERMTDPPPSETVEPTGIEQLLAAPADTGSTPPPDTGRTTSTTEYTTTPPPGNLAARGDWYTRRTRLYVVQAGDDGFWTVAKRMYGDGKYWPLIADANPSADPRELRKDQRLTVPPLPEKYLPKSQPRVRADTSRGERIYIVKKGDAGFWGVSVAVYGHGKHFKTIQDANPSVDADNLQPNMKLVIPRKPEPRRAAAAGAAATTVALPAGWRWYTVVSGDAGFWDVAVKMYGDGRLWQAIQKANPGVDSRRLQPKQKLRVPPKVNARRTESPPARTYVEEVPATGAASGTTGSLPPAGRPDFGKGN